MRRNYIANNAWMFILAAVLLVSACRENKGNHISAHNDPGLIRIDSNLSHLLKPSNKQVMSKLPVIRAEYGTRIFTEEAQGLIGYDSRNENSIASKISGRIERLLIRYNYQPVKKGQLIMEVYAPDLAAAQQELLFLKRVETDPAMLGRAKQRLMLLGMTPSGVDQVLRTGKVNYRIPVYSNADGYILEKPAAPAPATASVPSSAGNGMDNMGDAAAASGPALAEVPANQPVMLREGQYVSAGQSLFTIYNSDRLVAEFSLKPALAARVKKGTRFVFYKTADESTVQTAVIGMIQPVFKEGQNFTIARVYLSKPNFRVGELLTARIPVLLPESWWLPESAVVSLGGQTLLFKKEGNVFVPKTVRAGIVIAGMVQIEDDISNWQIGKNAAYLVDSESFIKTSE